MPLDVSGGRPMHSLLCSMSFDFCSNQYIIPEMVALLPHLHTCALPMLSAVQESNIPTCLSLTIPRLARREPIHSWLLLRARFQYRTLRALSSSDPMQLSWCFMLLESCHRICCLAWSKNVVGLNGECGFIRHCTLMNTCFGFLSELV
jgi:hypothetical protein